MHPQKSLLLIRVKVHGLKETVLTVMGPFGLSVRSQTARCDGTSLSLIYALRLGSLIN